MSNTHSSIKAKLNFVNPKPGVTPRVTYLGDNTPQQFNEAYQKLEVTIHNARSDQKLFKLHEHGFEMTQSDVQHINFDDETSIINNYYKEVEKLVKQTSGASHVFIFDHTIRKGLANSPRKPAQHVHVDYTTRTGPSRAAEMIGHQALEKLHGKRFIQVNVWRSINGTVEESPLALLDSQTLDENDLVTAEIEFRDKNRVGEIYALRHNAGQSWYYYPDMNEQDSLLIKGYDTDNDAVSHFTPHSAFDDPTSHADAKPRQSIEVRSFAFFE